MAQRKIIVGVHGIGDQIAFETIQQIARQFCKYYGLTGAVPLGRYHATLHRQSAGQLPVPYIFQSPPDPGLPDSLGFAEVYWADIARSVEEDGYALEEARRWAKTVVERLRTKYPPGSSAASLKEADYPLIKRILEELIDTISVLERLFFIAGKAGIFSFTLNKILTDFLGDVQLVCDFGYYRREILARFLTVMEGIRALDPDAEIYLVAHSEGTVLSFLGLLEALATPDRPEHAWIGQVRGFMTIGSPIDKHLILWPELWQDFTPVGPAPVPAGAITWCNYYDRGDPVGYNLETARHWLAARGWQAFSLKESTDFGFSRYPFPGKAHVDYWDDEGVFGHFIATVVQPPPLPGTPAGYKDATVPPVDRWSARLANFLVSTLVVFALFKGAAFLLYRGLGTFINLPEFTNALDVAVIARKSAGYALLLAGMTLAVRIPRLTREIRWHIGGYALFFGGGTAYVLLTNWEKLHTGNLPPVADPVLLSAGAVFAMTLLTSTFFPNTTTRPLLIYGGVATAALILAIAFTSLDFGSLLGLGLSTVAFYYLWWLAILVFDLVFVWHRYVRRSMAQQRLHEIYKSR